MKNGREPLEKFGTSWVHRLTSATRYSLAGLRWSFAHEFAFRAEAILLGCAVCGSALLARTFSDILTLLFPLVLAMAFELVNTALEQTINELGDGKIRPAFKVAKDCGSAAVFVVLMWAMLVWVSYLLGRFS